MMHDASVSDVDLCAYVDGELDASRRVAVEDYLSRHPDQAAAVMAELRRSSAMRLLTTPESAPPAALVTLARQLDRRFATRRLMRALPGLAAATILIAGVFLLQNVTVRSSQSDAHVLPNFADEALEANDTARLRYTMVSEEKDERIDRLAVRTAARIDFPSPPQDWRVVDTRLVPSDEGTGLEISFDAGTASPITFFAVPTPDHAPRLPVAQRVGNEAVAYWRRGDMGYALAGELPAAELDRMAHRFAGTQTS